MTVGTWQPDPAPLELNAALLDRIVRISDHLEEPTLGLSPDEVQRYSVLMRREPAEWQEAIAGRSDEDLIAMIRFFTVAEMRLPGWKAGARSPVIPLVRELRARGAYAPELTRWIRGVSDNRFLPYGSLLDRL
jgi:hypothetical protein